MKPVKWWPPKPGDKLRHFTIHIVGDRYRRVHALAYAVAVFEHRGQYHATVAEYLPGRRPGWSYETITGDMTTQLNYWPDGSDPPEDHARCEGCKESR